MVRYYYDFEDATKTGNMFWVQYYIDKDKNISLLDGLRGAYQ